MANLVPLFVDKDTGKIFATNAGFDSGNNQLQAFCYVHTQTTSSNQWVISHNQNTRFLIYQVYTSTHEHVLPDSVTIDNENQLTIKFNTPMTGVAHLLLFKV